MGIAAWIDEQRRVYADNAPMVREYRTQLRSTRAPWLLVGYLSMLVGMASLVYWGISMSSSGSPAIVQSQLQGFYYAVVGMLEFLVILAAPVIAASSVIGEYNTRMIDLVFSSPMSAKYFLVGKLVASYRYILLLLAVSLPVAAVSVVLGGATWSDVLSAYALVSFHGLLYMAVSMPIAVMTGKAIPTVVWSYIAVGGYCILSVIGFASSSARPDSGFVPALSGLSPFVSGVFAGLKTQIGPLELPIWAPTLVVTVLLVKTLVCGAGAVLTQAGSKEALSLRLHGLVVSFALSLLVALAMRGGPLAMGGSTSLPFAVWRTTWPFFIFLPYLSTWSAFGGGKTWPNGVWSLKWALRGTPASGLPYLAMLLLSVIGGYLVGSWDTLTIDSGLVIGLMGVAVYWALAWSLGWAASALASRQTPEVPRRLHVLFCFGVLILPLLLLAMLEGVSMAAGWGLSAGWTENFNMLSFFGPGDSENIIKIGVLALAAAFFAGLGEKRRRRVVDSFRRVTSEV